VIVDVQVNPGRCTWPEIRELALAAEEAGYGTVWTFDHLAGSSVRGTSMLETFTLLGALAVTTSTIELGAMVVNVHNRTPATLAVAAASVEAIADRPVRIGLGAGSSPGSRWSAEMRAIGQPVVDSVEGRHARVVEVLDVLGRMYAADRPADLATFPRPRHPMPVVIGASGPALATLAGCRADGVNVGWDHPRRDELLAAAVAARGGRRDGFELSTWVTWSPDLLDADQPRRRAMAAAGLDRLVLVVPAGVGPDDVSACRPS
jgi:alkanesulfonate monooxygenase SsuD/methylene tetrahydromethanopterin reductase-like flavin-dependent oxidoreductase (luciferase family)